MEIDVFDCLVSENGQVYFLLRYPDHLYLKIRLKVHLAWWELGFVLPLTFVEIGFFCVGILQNIMEEIHSIDRVSELEVNL